MLTFYRLFQLLPHTKLHVFNECGHWTQIEKTDRIIDYILTYVNTVNEPIKITRKSAGTFRRPVIGTFFKSFRSS
jgi:hypothetical protein